jgi:hypothetical protein
VVAFTNYNYNNACERDAPGAPQDERKHWPELGSSATVKLDDEEMGGISLPAHPRLRLNESGVQRIRQTNGPNGDPIASEMLKNISAHVAQLLDEPLPAGGMNGSHGATGLLCDTIRDHIYSYGLVYWLSANATERAHDLGGSCCG